MGTVLTLKTHALPPLKDAPLRHGEVALVGAGPGDVGLLTLSAYHLMLQADVVVFDRLVSDDILDLLPVRAERIDAGKLCRQHTLTQDQTNETLVRLANEGKRVLRLKGGDPFIFGRGGEEMEYLLEQGVNCRVIPGITSAQGCSTAAGFPLTHRDYAQSVTFVTGHRKADQTLDLDWQALANAHHTVVFYMGLANAAAIQRAMLHAGRAPQTPVALIENGTRPEQRVKVGTLDALTELIVAYAFKAPTMIVVGEVVTLANSRETHYLALNQRG